MATEMFKTAVELQLAELRGEKGDVAVSRRTCMDAGEGAGLLAGTALSGKPMPTNGVSRSQKGGHNSSGR